MAPPKKKDEPINMKVTVNGKALDLAGAAALNIGDWEDLVSLGVMDDSGSVNTSNPTAVIEIIHILARKVDPEITRDDVRTIPVTELRRLSAVVEKQLTAEDNRPAGAGDPT